MISLIISYIVCSFLFLEATEPGGAQTKTCAWLFVLSFAGYLCALFGIRGEKEALNSASFMIGALAMMAAGTLLLITLLR